MEEEHNNIADVVNHINITEDGRRRCWIKIFNESCKSSQLSADTPELGNKSGMEQNFN